ncbi:MAG: methylenetetrahydrofolate reductase [NAD(P)H] [Planctomycetota bacterium]|jgi:methylenetetrahydrofolate reductase (NADPH)|nr:methylenetetrahydrofolate reductase [NAD(P)H] [Planctomycetota bacterium]
MATTSVVETMRGRLFRRDPVFSFEFFPPRDAKGEETLARAMAELAPLNPAFVSVTCGAAGATRHLTRDLVCSLQSRHSFGVMAHITAVGHSREELAELVKDYHSRGIRSFLALRGDPPRDEPDWTPRPNQAKNAAEVVQIIRGLFPDVSIGVAGYPETHPEAESVESDLRYLRVKVEAGADFVVTQMFFDNAGYFAYEHRARKIGVKAPILPGIMPITRAGQIERFQSMCRVEIPEQLRLAIGSKDDPHRIREIGISFAAAQCADLLRRGAPGIHFFTLNQSRAGHAVFAALQAMGW